MTRTSCTTAGVLGLFLAAGTASAQTPTAPPPRANAPVIDGLGFWYVEKGSKDDPPAVEVTSEDGKVQVRVRWEGKGSSFTVSGTRAVIRDGVLTLTGLARERQDVILSSRRASDNAVRTRVVIGPDTRLDIVLADGTATYHNP